MENFSASRGFGNVSRIEPEADKIFRAMAQRAWFEDWERLQLVCAMAEHFGDLNMIYPFRERARPAHPVRAHHRQCRLRNQLVGPSKRSSGSTPMSRRSSATIARCKRCSKGASDSGLAIDWDMLPPR
ncbi:hypothetical protein [Cupriavidus sp. 8B]